MVERRETNELPVEEGPEWLTPQEAHALTICMHTRLDYGLSPADPDTDCRECSAREVCDLDG